MVEVVSDYVLVEVLVSSIASQPETTSAVEAINERYGTGAERQEKLLSTVKFRGVALSTQGIII